MAKRVVETRCTCLACGHVWHYTGGDAMKQVGENLSDLGQAMTCPCCCLPTPTRGRPVDQCPNCGSKANKKEQVVHEIP